MMPPAGLSGANSGANFPGDQRGSCKARRIPFPVGAGANSSSTARAAATSRIAPASAIAAQSTVAHCSAATTNSGMALDDVGAEHRDQLVADELGAGRPDCRAWRILVALQPRQSIP